MKPNIYNLSLSILFLFLVSCSSKSPESVVMEYLEAKGKRFDFEKAYSCLSASRKAKWSYENFDESGSSETQIAKKLSRLVEKTQFEVLSTTNRGDTSLVEVKEVHPDMSVIVDQSIGFGSAFSMIGLSGQERSDLIAKKINEYLDKTNAIPLKSWKSTYLLIIEEGQYKILGKENR